MKLYEFINHIKHNSVYINISNKFNHSIYSGTIGEFKTSVIKDKINNVNVKFIYPYKDKDGFDITTDDESILKEVN